MEPNFWAGLTLRPLRLDCCCAGAGAAAGELRRWRANGAAAGAVAPEALALCGPAASFRARRSACSSFTFLRRTCSTSDLLDVDGSSSSILRRCVL
eukprot:3069105-Prymnesium_polylepis.1